VSTVSDLVAHLLADSTVGVRWFRGQGCESRLLKASLPRKMSPYEPADLMKMEKRLITRFRQRSLPFWPEGYPQIDWDQLFAMQHFGIPTRLLDWSENAVVAAYFAADHDPQLCGCEAGGCKPTLWVLDPVQLNRLNSRLEGYGDAISVLATSDDAIGPWAPGTEDTRFAPWPIAVYGTHNSPRIVAQQGTFTVAGKNDKSLDEAPAVTQHDGILEKIVIDMDHPSLMKELKVLGITHGTVFPDLAGLSHDITAAELG
jgi:hypothetical protein